MTDAEREFQIFVKPAGALCNLECRYCYYLKKRALYPEPAPRMPVELLERYIVEHIEAAGGPVVSFSWHGGEPTVLGLEYFRTVVELERRHRPAGVRIVNGLQTNGLLLDEEWCAFLAAKGFGVGLSLDGPQEMHDRFRVTRGGKPSYRQAVRAFRLLRRHKVPCDLLCVVHSYNVRFPTRVYRFFKDLGAQFVGFLPVVEPAPDAEGGVSPETVPAEAFGDFLCTIFDEWIRSDTGRIRIQMFEEAARPGQGLDHSLCIFRQTCGEIPVLEHNGDLYACDHYVDPAHRLGNIGTQSLAELLDSPARRTFGLAKLETLPGYCRKCPVRPMCNGGCPKDRFLRTPEGEEGWNYLCAGYRRFFLHCLPYLPRLGLGWGAPSPVPGRREKGAAMPAVGRNDPCPCGSGRKYKKCCLRG